MNTKLIKIGNNVWVAGNSSLLSSVPSSVLDKNNIATINSALDHFRELSEVSLNW